MIGERVLIKPDQAPEEVGGIVIPETVRRETMAPNTGEVLAVGPDAKIVKAGQRVLWTKGTGQRVEYLGENCLILFERDIHFQFPSA